MNRQTLAIKETALRYKYLDTLTSIYYLANLLIKLCYYHESLTLYKRVYARYYIVLREDHLITRMCH